MEAILSEAEHDVRHLQNKFAGYMMRYRMILKVIHYMHTLIRRTPRYQEKDTTPDFGTKMLGVPEPVTPDRPSAVDSAPKTPRKIKVHFRHQQVTCICYELQVFADDETRQPSAEDDWLVYRKRSEQFKAIRKGSTVVQMREFSEGSGVTGGPDMVSLLKLQAHFGSIVAGPHNQFEFIFCSVSDKVAFRARGEFRTCLHKQIQTHGDLTGVEIIAAFTTVPPELVE